MALHILEQTETAPMTLLSWGIQFLIFKWEHPQDVTLVPLLMEITTKKLRIANPEHIISNFSELIKIIRQ